MSKVFLNIACGDRYIEGWLNFDYFPHSLSVQKVNLLSRLPLEDSSVDILYCSHFLEHIPKSKVNFFISECFRVLKSRAKIRLVLPDLEEICREYISQKNANEEEKANFLALELLDQCVRTKPGGDLESYYAEIGANKSKSKLQEYIRHRTGVDFSMYASSKKSSQFSVVKKIIENPKKTLYYFERAYCRLVISLLPSAFRDQNICFTQVGERHTWMYDFKNIFRLLDEHGFQNITKMTFDSTAIEEFPLDKLDINSEGGARKGSESMYIEATKI